MTGAFKYQESIMSDEMDENGPDSLLGTIIKALILVAIWPCLLVVLGIFMAYLLGSVALSWIGAHWLLTLEVLFGIVVIYGVFRRSLIPKVWKLVFGKVHVTPADNKVASILDFPERKFIPSTNLYCYQCIKKLSIQSFEIAGKYYCKDCSEKTALRNHS